MKAIKALIPAALALGMVGAAQAQMVVYGLLDGSYGKSIDADTKDLKADFHSGGDNGSGEGNSTSRFGIKGSTDVGSGIKANFKLETAGITSDGHVGTPDATTGVNSTPFFNRQAWLGFSGGFGEVRLGRQDSVPFQTMIDFDFNGASNGISALGYANAAIWGRGRQSRSLQYISPTLSGAKVQLGYTPEGNVAGNKANGSAAVTYTIGPVAVAASFESKRTETSERFASVASTYDFGVGKVMLGYADGGKNAKARGVNAGLNLTFGGVNFGGLVAKNRDTKGLAFELYANKEVLKNTIAYVEAGRMDDKAAVAYTGNASAPAATGFAVGVIYIF